LLVSVCFFYNLVLFNRKASLSFDRFSNLLLLTIESLSMVETPQYSRTVTLNGQEMGYTGQPGPAFVLWINDLFNLSFNCFQGYSDLQMSHVYNALVRMKRSLVMMPATNFTFLVTQDLNTHQVFANRPRTEVILSLSNLTAAMLVVSFFQCITVIVASCTRSNTCATLAS
jgi:hypothetical protein